MYHWIRHYQILPLLNVENCFNRFNWYRFKFNLNIFNNIQPNEMKTKNFYFVSSVLFIAWFQYSFSCRCICHTVFLDSQQVFDAHNIITFIFKIHIVLKMEKALWFRCNASRTVPESFNRINWVRYCLFFHLILFDSKFCFSFHFPFIVHKQETGSFTIHT